MEFLASFILSAGEVRASKGHYGYASNDVSISFF